VQTAIFDDAKAAVSRLLIESVAPGGEWRPDGDYWPCSPLRLDGKPGSFHISPDGQWFDFSAGEGGDFVELVARVRGVKPLEAAKWILEQTGRAPAEETKPKRTKPSAVIPIPEEAKAGLNREIQGDYARSKHGKVAGGWRYHTAAGGWAFAVVRYNQADGSKDVIPYYYGTDGKWHEGQAYKDKRPLYRLPEVVASELPVLVVEGEKCAAVEVPGYVVTTWSAGASSVGKTDWTPLEGRRVIVWPDFDEPGLKAAGEIKKRLPSAEILRIHHDDGRALGWDIADARGEGIDLAAFVAGCPRTEEPKADESELRPELPDGELVPFRCLGYDADHYWFLQGKQRQLFAIAKGTFNASKLGELAPPAWWAALGAINDKGGIDVGRGQQIIIELQTEAGMFDSSRLRGAGVWQEGDEIVINDGGHIVDVEGNRVALADYQGTGEYMRSSVHFGDMSGEESTPEEGRKLADLFAAQRWRRGLDSVAVLGWSLIAPFGGLLSVRPHLWVTGRKGTGKSWLLENLVREVCGPFAHSGSGKDTEAGIRRTLNQDARPVILDEMEPKSKAERENLSKILVLARNAFSDGSGRVTMADGGKGTVSFLVRSAFCFASVNAMDNEGAAIASRIIQTELEASKGPRDDREKIALSRTLYGEAMRDPSRYRRRIFRAMPRIMEDIKLLRDELSAELGGARGADLWAPIYAAWWAVQSDESVMCDAGKEWLARCLEEYALTRDEAPEDEHRVIGHILSAVVESDDKKKKTIAEWLEISSDRDDGFIGARELMERHGLKIVDRRDGTRVLCVAAKSDALSKILRDTPYESGYEAQIKRNQYCKNATKAAPQRIARQLTQVYMLDWASFRDTYLGVSA
jgi:putative DNA primase/helicase